MPAGSGSKADKQAAARSLKASRGDTSSSQAIVGSALGTVVIAGAGRTDKGVSASCMVSFYGTAGSGWRCQGH